MWDKISELYNYREMLNNLVRKDLRTRYKGSVLGFFWAFLNPLLLLIVYTVVFSVIMRVNIDNFAMYLFVALLPWIFFSTSVLNSTSSIVGNKNLIQKVYFPREIIPLSIVNAGLVNLFYGFCIMFPCLLFFGISITSAVMYLPLVVLVIYITTLGVSLIASCVNVYFRDIEHILGIAMTAWFFFTPILYAPEMIPSRYLSLFFINPMAPIMLTFRDILYYGRPPDLTVLSISFAVAVLILLFGYNLFLLLQKDFAEEI